MPSPSSRPRLVFLGVGACALAVARAARSTHELVGTTRSSDRAALLEAAGIEAVVAPELAVERVSAITAGAHVLVTFPPDGATDARIAPACGEAKSIVYISSTGVYGPYFGKVDDSTPVDPSNANEKARLEAEHAWHAVGATVLRAPGLYDATTGLHKRLASGKFRLTGEGANPISRIHLDDLASFVLAASTPKFRGETFVVGDLAPVPQREAVAWLCDKMGLPLPASVDPSEVHHTLRGGRAVDPSRALALLGVSLKYPTYKEGFGAALAAVASDSGAV